MGQATYLKEAQASTMLTESELLQSVEQGEAFDYEFKSAKGGIPHSLWETYSAMGNSRGGVIILGVEEDNSLFRVTGLTDPEKAHKNIWDSLHDRHKVSLNLCSDEDIVLQEVTGKTVLVMRVPLATRRQRPVYLGQNPLTGTYRRHDVGDYKCSADEVGRMLADQSDEPADSRIVEGFTLQDLDGASLTQYRQRFSARAPDHPWLTLEPIALLEKLGGWRRDRHTEQEGLTVAGLLMFGKNEAISNPQALPNYHVDYQEHHSEDVEIRWTDRLYPDGIWTANIFQFYQQVITRLTRDLRIPFQLKPSLFRKDETIVHEALREALVNALIHADYRGMGGIVIHKRRHGIELSNPGTLLISLEQLLRGGVSECRNKSLQRMFQMIGGGEKAGSGVDKILQGWNSQQWLPPDIISQFDPDRVVWWLPFSNWFPQPALDHLNKLFGERLKSLTPHERLALVTAYIEGEVTNARLQLVSELHPADISKMLRGMVAKGFFTQDGPNRRMKYRLPAAQSDFNSSPSNADSLQNDADSLPCSPDSLPKKGDSSPRSEGKSSEITGEEIVRLRALAYPEGLPRRVRLRETMREAILRVCDGRYLTAHQLAAILERNRDSLRNRYLSSLVHEKKLRLLYPEDLNRPDQAYTTHSSPS